VNSDDGKETGHPFINHRRSRGFCIAPFREMLILSDGRAVFCCMDAFGKAPMGDVNKESLHQIWHNHLYRTLRRRHLTKQKHLNPICSNCFVTY
jgi:radical SAM protein with 4Fe4S-binding SPASM domain